MKVLNYLSGLCFGICMLLLGTTHAQNNVQIRGSLGECATDTLLFFELDGVSLRPTAKIPLTETTEGNKAFQIEIANVAEGFYFIGQGKQNNTRMILLGDEPKIALQGSCPALNKARILQSSLNEALTSANKQSDQLAREFQQQIRLYQQARRNRGNLAEVEQNMSKIDARKLSLYDSLQLHQPFLSKVIALRTYLSFQNHGEGTKNESVYFAENYFRFVDLSDPAYNTMPQFHESVKVYAATLTNLNLNGKVQKAYFDKILAQIPNENRAYKAALLGGVSGFQGKNDYAFVGLAEQYVEEFSGDNPGIAQQLMGQISKAKAKMIGAIAPEISLPTPEGDTVHLSDFRGKVVLVDFWASWCGPCRRENPNVVRLYNKYKDQGFEILGVSLDRSKDSWVKAIEKDGLSWQHISDLKYWKSIAAQTYGVSSIPYTLLLDEEGKIVAKKLRGAELETMVAKLLKEKEDRSKEGK